MTRTPTLIRKPITEEDVTKALKKVLPVLDLASTQKLAVAYLKKIRMGKLDVTRFHPQEFEAVLQAGTTFEGLKFLR